MDRLTRERPSGLSADALRAWGLVCMLLGILGTAVIQRRFLNVDSLTAQELLAAMEKPSGMALSTLALVLSAIETCAAPIFCFLLVEGFTRTSNFGKYFARILGTGVLAELPYNYIMTGEFLDFTTQNPVLAMVLCLVVLYFLRRYSGWSFSNAAIKVAVFLAAILWCAMLRISEGPCCLLLTLVIWSLRNKPMYRDFLGAVVAVLCCLFNPFYLAAPMSFLLIHFYNGERREQGHLVNYLAYPAILTLVSVAVNLI